jgi:hypothetical protein
MYQVVALVILRNDVLAIREDIDDVTGKAEGARYIQGKVGGRTRQYTGSIELTPQYLIDAAVVTAVGIDILKSDYSEIIDDVRVAQVDNLCPQCSRQRQALPVAGLRMRIYTDRPQILPRHRQQGSG